MKRLYGDLIRQAREEAGLTIAQLADRCHIQEWQLELAEAGEIEISDEEFVLITNALDVSMAEMMQGELLKKGDKPSLDELFQRVENKMGELKECFLEMKAAAAVIIRKTQTELTAEKVVGPTEKEAPEKTKVKSIEDTGDMKTAGIMAEAASAAVEQHKEIQTPRL